MAARRLLLVMVLLLVVSSLAAALVPPPPPTTTTTTEAEPSAPFAPPPAHGGRAVSKTIVAAGRRRAEIHVTAGDQLSLAVRSPRFIEVLIPRFGLIDFAEPGAPARFDLLVERPGSFDVRTREGDRTIAVVVARPRAGAERGEEEGASRSASSA